MSRANNPVWKSLSATLSEVLNQTLDKASAESVMTNWDTKKKEVNRILEKKSNKKKVDPNAPKRPNTSYIIYSMEQRNKIKQQYPELSTTDILKKLGESWNSLTAQDKKQYENLAKKDKERYENEMKSYVPSESFEQKTTRKKKADGPKHPLTAYMFFCLEKRDSVKKEFPDLKDKDITRELANKWKSLSDEQKSPYSAKQAQDKKRYEDEKKSAGILTKKTEKKSRSKKEDTNNSKKNTKKTEGKKESKKTDQKKTCEFKKTPGFEYFLKEQSEEISVENPFLNKKEIVSEVTKRWGHLTNEERNAYENEADFGSEVELEDE